MLKNIVSFLFLLAVVAQGCRVGPRYHPPAPRVPDEWKTPQAQENSSSSTCYWWEVFQDDTLNELQTQAISNNPNLYVALARIEEAWALTGAARADLFPQLNLNPSYNSSGSLFKIYLPGNVSLPGLTGQNLVFRIHQLLFSLPINMSYELDLWGKYRQQYESAFLNAEAQADAYSTALLSLTADVASSYFDLRTLGATVDLLKVILDIRQQEYELSQTRFNNGLVNYTQVTSPLEALLSAQTDYYDALRQKALQENLLALLVGVPASNFQLCLLPLKNVPPIIPASLPSIVLLQRPDIAQAEREMASQHAQIGVAYASFFPSFQLTGAIGFLSPDFREFMKWQSRYWSIGGNIGQTLFDGGRKISNLDIALARFKEASGTYQQQVLVAFQEVENALNNLDFQAKQAESLAGVLNAARQGTNISEKRYQQGVANYFEVLNSRRTQSNAELQTISLNGQRYQATIQLIKAIGGKWSGDSSSKEPCGSY